MRLIDRAGHIYERLTVLSRAPNIGGNDTNARWNCRCVCGKMVVAYGGDLAKGKVKSCGCWSIQRATKHGLSRDPVHHVWRQMFQRCENPKSPSFKNYGARGIAVCEEWRDFNVFISDMGFPGPLGSIERRDNSRGYSKENCRWATMREQTNNSRRNVRLKFEGQNLTISQWSRRLKISRDAIHGRLRRGWSVEQTLSTPVNPERGGWPRK